MPMRGSIGDGDYMCTEKDCNIFRGMIMACDECERNAELPASMNAGMAKPQMQGPPSMN